MGNTDITVYIKENQQRFHKELKDFLSIPSISTNPKYTEHMHAASKWLVNHLQTMKVHNCELIETKGHPVVYGEILVDPLKPTVLVYGHYDVQPPDPINKWSHPPFKPIIKNNKIYARGASDDKGQVHMQLKAIEHLLESKQLACNIIFLYEGEEECGSPNLADVLTEHKEKISCDAILISDTALIDKQTPSITTGLRGIVTSEITVKSLTRDVHSGVYGGAVENPIHVLCKMMAKLEDEQYKITIPGFYENVAPLSQAEKEVHKQTAKKFEKQWQQEIAVKSLINETEYGSYESVIVRPSIDINGIWGGYTNEGEKSVIPHCAHAKISIRLVPNQTPQEVTTKLQKYLKKIAPQTVEVSVSRGKGANPSTINMGSPEFEAARCAFKNVYGKEPIPYRSGGSIAAVSLCKEYLEIDPLMLGFGLESDNIHAPDEHFDLENYENGIKVIAGWLKELGNKT